MSKTTRGKSNVDTMLGEEIEGCRVKLTLWHNVVEMTCVKGQRCGDNGGQE